MPRRRSPLPSINSKFAVSDDQRAMCKALGLQISQWNSMRNYPWLNCDGEGHDGATRTCRMHTTGHIDLWTLHMMSTHIQTTYRQLVGLDPPEAPRGGHPDIPA